ncbi:hypothetical protein K1W54_01010 [Micromonospora sp. CPCC 205371]|nr:hypothetical protein [Micromonospora sp. CPCC 205371]
MTETPQQPVPEEVRSHRAPPGPVQRVGTKASVGTLLIAALAIGGLIASWRPLGGGATEERERPFVRAGQVGDTVSARVFDAKVVSVSGAGKVRLKGAAIDTGGVWIIVRARITATDEETSVGYAALRDARDRVFLASTRIEQRMIGVRSFQPGIPVEGAFVFEVPRDAATNLTLLLARQSIDRRMDAMAEIELSTYDSPTIDTWAAAAEPVTIDEPKVVP